MKFPRNFSLSSNLLDDGGSFFFVDGINIVSGKYYPLYLPILGGSFTLNGPLYSNATTIYYGGSNLLFLVPAVISTLHVISQAASFPRIDIYNYVNITDLLNWNGTGALSSYPKTVCEYFYSMLIFFKGSVEFDA